MSERTPPFGSLAAAQRGASLFITLIALVLLTFAGLALLRSVDTGTLISGNLGFQEAAVAAGDAGTEAAVTWLSANSAGSTLFADIKTSGYYSTSSDSCDLTGSTLAGATNDINWTGTDPGAGCAMDALIMPANSAGVPAGYTVAYVINRICNAPGDPNSAVAADGATAMVCAQYISPATDDSSTRVGAPYGEGPLVGVPQHYYRITSRITGPRNTVRFIQAFVVV
jgi:type IV pilus assembly protein PilX